MASKLFRAVLRTQNQSHLGRKFDGQYFSTKELVAVEQDQQFEPYGYKVARVDSF